MLDDYGCSSTHLASNKASSIYLRTMPKPLTSPIQAVRPSSSGMTEKVSFRIPRDVYTKLQSMGEKRKRSLPEIARELVLLAMEAPERSDLVREVYELSAGVSLLQEKLTLLEAQNMGLILTVARISELLLVNLLNIEPEAASEVIGEIINDSFGED